MCIRDRVNGESSPEFELGSGVAQGCPLSPLLFLFIAEPLTRLVMQDEELKGVKIGGYTHKIAQFADDTAAYLKNWQQLPRLFELVSRSVHADNLQTTADTCRHFGVLYGEGLGSSPWVCDPMGCLLYTSPSPRDRTRSRMPSSA